MSESEIVAKGNEQEEGIGFWETYSHVVRTAMVWLVFHLAVISKWEIKQLDVKNAFLHRDLQETIFMRQPPGFESKDHPDYVFKLKKAIYGLKQAPRVWFDKLSSYLIEFRFKCCTRDPSLFIYSDGKNMMLLLLYVDDMTLTGNNKSFLAEFVGQLGTRFRVKDMGPLSYFLGIKATTTSSGLFLNQEKYAMDLLQSAAMLDCSPMPTPLPIQLNRVPHQDELFSEPTYFRSLAGKLQYLTLTRPDLQFAVNYVCQKMHQPTISDFQLLKRILRYLKGTINMGLTLQSDIDSTLRAYCDSDWAGFNTTRRSTGGFSTFLGANIISWSAQKQDSVPRSSTEAEYRLLSDTAAELSWIDAVLAEMGLRHIRPAEVYCDNLSAVHLTANPVLHKRTKHFETHYHYARERVAKGSLVVKHIPATQQIADIFTKSLPIHSFKDLRFKLGVERPPTSSLRGDISDNGLEAQKHSKPTQQNNKATVINARDKAESNSKDSTVPAIKTRNMFSVLGDKVEQL